MTSITSPSAARSAAHVATVAFALTMLLQILLAIGVLPVTMAWGGSQHILTTSLRLTGVAAAVVLAFFAYVVRRRAGLSKTSPPGRLLKAGSWLITAYLFFNTFANLASPSIGEKILFGPISLVLALACLIISASRLAD